MNTLRSIVVGVSLAVGAFLVAWGDGSVAAEGDAPKAVQKWQYRSVSGEGVGEFDELGAEGWELCVAIPGWQNQRATFIFKRPIR